MKKRDRREIILFLINMLLAFCAIRFIANSYNKVDIELTPYTEFKQMCEDGLVDRVVYSVYEEEMSFYLYNEDTKEMSFDERRKYVYPKESEKKTLYPAYDTFRQDLLSSDIDLVVKQRVEWVSLIVNIIGVAFPFVLIFLMVKLMQKETKGVDLDVYDNNSKSPDVTFDSIIGQEEIIDDIKVIVDLIKNKDKCIEMGIRVPRGIILSGAPGVGKTLIAKAIAGETGLKFISANGSDFKNLYVGAGARHVRNLFKKARELKPCILFIDEFDAIATSRENSTAHSEDIQTIGAMLKELDGFSDRDGVFVLVATNYATRLDPAMTRAGRFDRRIEISPPRDWKVRKEMLDHFLKKCKISDDLDTSEIAKLSVGFTGADIETLCNDAGIIAISNGKAFIDMASMEEAFDRKVFNGNRSKHKDDYERERKLVAYHEAGHAVMRYILGMPLSRATITPTTNGVGGAVFGKDDQNTFETAKDFKNDILVCYAGRASEQIRFGEVSIGASSDIEKATKILTEYVCLYGFDNEFGLVNAQVLSNSGINSSEEVSKRVQSLASEFYKECSDMLKEKYDMVERLAVSLIENETLYEEEIIRVLTSEEDSSNEAIE